jgi:hypothetical protein
MSILPKEIKLTLHAQQRLEERKGSEKYNTKNLMKSSCKWYGKDDLIPESSLYIHCMYVCRKAKNKMGYLTDGNIEVLYDKNAKVAITILEVKDKFKPITQYIKPEYLKEIELKKEKKKMRKKIELKGVCPDCGKEVTNITSQGICVKCRTRKWNANHRQKEYIPYINLSAEEKSKIDSMQASNSRKHEEVKKEEILEPVLEMKVPDNETYYQAKATQSPVPMRTVANTKTTIEKTIDPLSDQFSFISVLKECGCDISEEDLKKLLDVLVATDKLKDILMKVADDTIQDTMLNLEQVLPTAERKLQYNWECNGFQEVDDIKFKGFLTWRRMIKGAMYFWKKLYQTNTLVELKKTWESYITNMTNPTINNQNEKIVTVQQKRYQITTESISTIYNTKRPFTRVFYATSKEEAYDKFVKWMAERQLHEDKSKTTIVELSSEGIDGRDMNEIK